MVIAYFCNDVQFGLFVRLADAGLGHRTDCDSPGTDAGHPYTIRCIPVWQNRERSRCIVIRTGRVPVTQITAAGGRNARRTEGCICLQRN